MRERTLFECYILEDEHHRSSSIIGEKRKSETQVDGNVAKNDGNLSMQMDDQGIAADHYNNLVRDLDTRSSSQIYHLRNLNGFVKTTLINTSSTSLIQRKVVFAEKGFRVLDLCCGHGGDMNKWLKNNTENCAEYVGVDIAEAALMDFLTRLNDHKKRDRVSKLIVADIGRQVMSENSMRVFTWSSGWHDTIPLSLESKFDIASCQFALHYMFESAERANSFFAQVDRHLVEGGTFIATTVDSRVLVDMVHRTYAQQGGTQGTVQ